MVVLALDYGDKRIGVAVSDPLGIAASGLKTIERTPGGAEFDSIAEVVAERNVERIVVGMPLRMDGSAGRQVQKVRSFVERLRKRLPHVPIETIDERLTSAQAHRVLSDSGATNRVRRKNVDTMAAQIILTRYLLRQAGRDREQ